MLPLIPLLLAGGSAIGGALSNTKGARTSTTTPTVAPEFKTLQDLLRSRAEGRLRDSSMFGQDPLGGYESSGIQNINNVFRNLKTTSDANLTSRGLGTSPVAGTVDSNLETARGGGIAEFLNTLPLLRRQMEDQDFGNALSLYHTGVGNTGVGAGSALGSGLGSAAEMLAFLKGQGVF